MYKKIISIFMIMAFTADAFLCLAATIKLKDGRTVEGKILEKTDSYIKISFQGVPLTYYYNDIVSIDGQDINKDITEYDAIGRVTEKTGSTQDKDGSQLFKELADAVVYIRTNTGQGSGFLIDGSGVVVTNWHVIGASDDITVSLKDGSSYKPTAIINYDILKDVCVLQLDVPKKLPFIPLGDFNSVEIGQKAFVIGNPMGLKYLISDGIISQKEDEVDGKILQFTCPISPGSSGGPVINAQGQAIGIVMASYVDPTLSPQNLNLAISVEELKSLLSQNRQLKPEEYLSLTKGYSILQQGYELEAKGELKKAFELYKKVFNQTCLSRDKKDNECLLLFYQALSVSLRGTGYWGKRYFSGMAELIRKGELSSSNAEQKKLDEYLGEMLTWCDLNIGIIESGGGLKALYELFTSSGFIPAKDWNKFKEALCLGYFNLASTAAFNPKGKNLFYKCAQKIQEAFPESQTVQLLLEQEKLGEAIWEKR